MKRATWIGLGLVTLVVSCASVLGIRDGRKVEDTGAGGTGAAGGEDLCASDSGGACATVCDAQCYVEPTPTGSSDDCPAVCDGGCTDGGECRIRCQDKDSCRGAVLTCPDGFSCRLKCTGQDACTDARLACPPGQLCDVFCEASKSCTRLEIQCGTAPCNLVCTPPHNACVDTQLRCCGHSCRATCQGQSSVPDVDCGSSCDCQDQCEIDPTALGGTGGTGGTGGSGGAAGSGG